MRREANLVSNERIAQREWIPATQPVFLPMDFTAMNELFDTFGSEGHTQSLAWTHSSQHSGLSVAPQLLCAEVGGSTSER